VLPENKAAGISLTGMTRKDRPEVWDKEMWRNAMKMVQGSEPGPGFTQDEWNRGIKHLAGGISRGGTLEEMIVEAWRLEPLRGFEESEWRMFLRIAEVDLKRANRWLEGTKKHSKERRGLLPLTMDMMKKVEMSLELP
jgi:hypothetical protein